MDLQAQLCNCKGWVGFWIVYSSVVSTSSGQMDFFTRCCVRLCRAALSNTSFSLCVSSPPSQLLSIQLPMCWVLRCIHCRRWIFSCFGVVQPPDSPIPFAWVIRDYIQQDALLCKGREPERSGGGWAFLQRRPREALLWPPRDWPWQLWRCLLCTANTPSHCLIRKRNAREPASGQKL